MYTLILSNPAEEHGRHVADALLKRGRKALFFDTASFPAQCQIAFAPDGGGSIRLPDHPRLAFSEIDSVYWRNYNKVQTGFADVDPSFSEAYVANNDSRALMESLLMNLDVRWVNGWTGYWLHQRKPAALAMVKAEGALIPKTLVSNDPDEIEAFLDETPHAIQKPVQGGQHTRRVEKGFIQRIKASPVPFAPATFQEEIKGTNVRAFVCGERVLACEIRTGEVDFRDDKRPDFFVHELPQDVAERTRKIATRLGLVWSGIDYRLTADGRYYFLEANPSPMFIGFEKYAGLPLTEALCEVLIG